MVLRVPGHAQVRDAPVIAIGDALKQIEVGLDGRRRGSRLLNADRVQVDLNRDLAPKRAPSSRPHLVARLLGEVIGQSAHSPLLNGGARLTQEVIAYKLQPEATTLCIDGIEVAPTIRCG